MLDKKLTRRWGSERELFLRRHRRWIRWNNANKGHYALQGHSRSPILVYQSKAHTRLTISD